MCLRCCFKEIISSLEVKISNNPSSLPRLWFAVYAFGRTVCIELVIYVNARGNTNYLRQEKTSAVPHKFLA